MLISDAMFAEDIRLLILLIGATISSYTDLKEGLIYDKVTYPMIALGVLFISLDLFFERNLYYLLIPLVIFLFSYLLYFSGKLGGGDVKIFLATALLLPYYRGQPFLLSALLIAALTSSLVISAIILFKFFRIKKRSKIVLSADLLRSIALGIVILLYFVALAYLGTLNTLALIIFSIPLFSSLVFLAFRRQIQECFFLRWLSIDELEEDEIIAKEFLDKSIVSRLGLSMRGIISEKDKERLKSIGITKLPVYRDLPPFGPFLLFGIAVSAFIPDLFLKLFVA
jgi:Flp pilus assembly protein protease CpaA